MRLLPVEQGEPPAYTAGQGRDPPSAYFAEDATAGQKAADWLATNGANDVRYHKVGERWIFTYSDRRQLQTLINSAQEKSVRDLLTALTSNGDTNITVQSRGNSWNYSNTKASEFEMGWLKEIAVKGTQDFFDKNMAWPTVPGSGGKQRAYLYPGEYKWVGPHGGMLQPRVFTDDDVRAALRKLNPNDSDAQLEVRLQAYKLDDAFRQAHSERMKYDKQYVDSMPEWERALANADGAKRIKAYEDTFKAFLAKWEDDQYKIIDYLGRSVQTTTIMAVPESAILFAALQVGIHGDGDAAASALIEGALGRFIPLAFSRVFGTAAAHAPTAAQLAAVRAETRLLNEASNAARAAAIARGATQNEAATAARAAAREAARILAEATTEAEIQALAQVATESARRAAASELVTRLVHRATSGATVATTPGRSTTVIGRFTGDLQHIIDQLGYPAADSLAHIPMNGQSGGLNILNATSRLHGEISRTGSFFESVNRPWLLNAIRRGDDIIVVTPPTAANIFENGVSGALTGFGKEIQLLERNGYHYVAGRMVRRAAR